MDKKTIVGLIAGATLLGGVLLSSPSSTPRERTFIIPVIGTGTGFPGDENFDPFRPKYMFELDPVPKFQSKSYGFEKVMLVTAILTDEEADSILANTDVLEITENPLSEKDKSFLEERKIPTDTLENKKIEKLTNLFLLVQKLRSEDINPFMENSLDDVATKSDFQEVGISVKNGEKIRDVLNEEILK